MAAENRIDTRAIWKVRQTALEQVTDPTWEKSG